MLGHIWFKQYYLYQTLHRKEIRFIRPNDQQFVIVMQRAPNKILNKNLLHQKILWPKLLSNFIIFSNNKLDSFL